MASRILAQGNGALTEADRLQLAQLLVKAGYTVRLGRAKRVQKTRVFYDHFVEFEGDDDQAKGGGARDE